MDDHAASSRRLGVPAAAWALYDFGYSLFVYVVFARYLSDFIISDLGHPDWVYTSGQVVTAVLLLGLMPLAGVAADVIGRHVPLLATFTILAATAGGLLGIMDPDLGALGVLPLLALGVVSAVGVSLAFAQFDPMLAVVAPRRQWGVMSGIAVAAGYAGIVTWLAVLAGSIVGEGDKQQAFIPAAVLFLVLSAPLMLLSGERRRSDRTDVPARPGAITRAASAELANAVRRLAGQHDVLRLLVGRFLYTDAVGTVNIFAVVYMSRIGGFSESDKNQATLLVVLCAGLGALGSGWLARRIGPRLTLLRILPLFTVGLSTVAWFGEPWTVWLLAPVLGISLGTVYTVDRVFMLALTPPHLRGELFGFFNLIGRVAQALGPFVLWGGTILVLHDATGWLSALDASRVSLVLIAIAVVVGLRVIHPLDDRSGSASSASPEPDPEPEALPQQVS